MIRTVAILCLVTACGSFEPSLSSPRTAADLGPMCHRRFAHEAACRDEYLGALIDLRAELDNPPGTRAALATQGKPALLDRARAEWQLDTAPDKVDQVCAAMVTQTPPEEVRPLLAAGDQCEVAHGCAAFAKCAVATERRFIASGGAR